MDEAVVDQWYLTLTILTSLAIIPVYWCMIALSPTSNSTETEWVFLIISTTGLCMFIWTWSKFYLDRYVRLEKI